MLSRENASYVALRRALTEAPLSSPPRLPDVHRSEFVLSNRVVQGQRDPALKAQPGREQPIAPTAVQSESALSNRGVEFRPYCFNSLLTIFFSGSAGPVACEPIGWFPLPL